MILKGDCIEVMKAMKPNSVDAICTDPPYGLEFMGKKWDKLWDKREFGKTEYSKKSFTCSDGSTRKTNPVTRNLKNPNYKAGIEAQLWHTQWLTEAYRVLKPGGSMLVMGGTRTSHRLACAIEDTGFIIKDTLMYLYGSGFPKAQDLTKMLEKRNAKKATEQDTKYNLRPMRKSDISQTISNKETKENTMQSSLSKQGISEYRKEGSESEIANGEQPSVEGRSNLFQEEGKLQERSLHKSSTMGNTDGKKRRVHNGTSANNGLGAKQVIDKERSSSSHRSQSPEQLANKSDVIQEQSGAQNMGRWGGFKVGGIKPAYEPIIWAVKPPEGSYIDNVLKWGVGAVNVDECRIGIGGDYTIHNMGSSGSGIYEANKSDKFDSSKEYNQTKGRFPANVILSHHPSCQQVGVKRVKNQGGVPDRDTVKNSKPAFTSKDHTSTIHHFEKDGYEQVESWDCHPDCAVRVLDEQSGVLKSGARKGQISKPATNVYGEYKGKPLNCESSSGGASRFFKQCNYGQEEWLCHENCALRQLDEQSGILKSGANPERRNSAKTKTCYGEFEGQKECISYRGQNSGGASRFLYCAKASRAERNAGLEGMEEKQIKRLSGGKFEHNSGSLNSDKNGAKSKNNHPTVKPIKLFEWLIKLVTREDQTILDPFIGSGTTAIAAHNTGRKCIGIEKEEEYIEIATRRTAYWRSRPRQLEII